MNLSINTLNLSFSQNKNVNKPKTLNNNVSFQGCGIKEQRYRWCNSEPSDSPHEYTDQEKAMQRIKAESEFLRKYRNDKDDMLKYIQALSEKVKMLETTLIKRMELIRNGFDYVNMNDKTFENMSFSHMNLENANLSNSKFKNADFSNCNLKNSNLSNSQFLNVDFSTCDLRKANLENATFENCSFDEALLKGVNLKDAKFKHTTLNYNDSQLKKTIYMQ